MEVETKKIKPILAHIYNTGFDRVQGQFQEAHFPSGKFCCLADLRDDGLLRLLIRHPLGFHLAVYPCGYDGSASPTG